MSIIYGVIKKLFRILRYKFSVYPVIWVLLLRSHLQAPSLYSSKTFWLNSTSFVLLSFEQIYLHLPENLNLLFKMLNGHGKVAIAQLCFYVPALIFSLWPTFQLRRQSGWFHLILFSLLRIGGAVVLIDIEEYPNSVSSTKISVATVLNTVALSPLMAATLSFLNPSSRSKAGRSCLAKPLKIVHLVVIIATGLGITGATNITKASPNSSTLDSGVGYLKIVSLMFLLTWCVLALATFVFWTIRSQLEYKQRVTLVAVTIVLPFLLVRVIYASLNAINLNTSTSTGHTQKFNPMTGDWLLYLGLGFCMEIAIYVVYLIAGVCNCLLHDRDNDHMEEQYSLI